MDSAGHGTVLLADSTDETNDSISLSKLKAKFANAAIPFEGLWVNKHYIDEIRRRKSLREAQDTETRCIVIPGHTLEVTRWIYGFHEGGESMVLVKKGPGYFSYSLYNGRCIDTFEVFGNAKLKIGREYYFRLGAEDSASSDLGVLEQLLFEGKYQRQDSAATVIFAKDGEIQGLDSLESYDPVIDYVDFPTNVDHIRLGKDKKHLNDYGLRFVGDTMMIYSINCLQHAGRDFVSDTLGQLMYALRRLE
jgi:hypothetical protein